MRNLRKQTSSEAHRNSDGITIQFCRPQIVRERDGWGWLVLLPSGHAWLAGDRRAALTEFAELERIERGSPS
jgi:hypothetical protein